MNVQIRGGGTGNYSVDGEELGFDCRSVGMFNEL